VNEISNIIFSGNLGVVSKYSFLYYPIYETKTFHSQDNLIIVAGYSTEDKTQSICKSILGCKGEARWFLSAGFHS
jgi:hypothetical protein